MAKKTRNQRKAPSKRRDLPARPAPDAAATDTAGTAPAAAARRTVQRLDPATQRSTATARAAKGPTDFGTLDAADAGIPFDRVPYVPADLRRVAIMASLMVVLIIVANLVISHFAT